MSCYDFLTSIAQGLSTWPIPADSGVVYAAGTTFTCSFQGFFTQLGVGAPMYNCSLSFYYLIVIAFAFSEDRVKQIEWFMQEGSYTCIKLIVSILTGHFSVRFDEGCNSVSGYQLLSSPVFLLS